MTNAFRIGLFRVFLLMALPFLLTVGVFFLGQWANRKLPKDPGTPYGGALQFANVRENEQPNGAKLFAQHCAYCHGIKGDGNGVAQLTNKARHFGKEKYRFASTSGVTPVPTDDDLHRIIQRGIPGSPMPAFQLTERERSAIIGHLRQLTWSGVYERLLKKQQDDPEGDTSATYITKMATNELASGGQLIPVPANLAPQPDSLKRGEALFKSTTTGCSKCHGEKGLGDGEQVKDPKFTYDNGLRATPRNLTSGIYKGGDHEQDLYRRIFNGIPGTPMPASSTALKPEEIIDVIHYVKSLAK